MHRKTTRKIALVLKIFKCTVNVDLSVLSVTLADEKEKHR